MRKILSLVLSLGLLTSPLYAAVSGVTSNQSTAGTLAVNLSSTTITTQPTNLGFTGAAYYWDGSTFTIDNSAAGITSGTINGATIGATTAANLNYLRPIVTITSTASTLASVGPYNGNNSVVTIGKTGSLFVLQSLIGDPATGAGPTVSLPGTYQTVSGSLTGLTYTFVTSTGSTLSVRTASSTDATIVYGGAIGQGTTTRVTSPASSGSTITVVGVGSTWVIGSMNSGATGTQTGWTNGTF